MPQPNMQKMLKQVQRMQADMMAAQERLKDEVVEATAGGGMVTVKINGGFELQSITIRKDCIDPEDPEMMQDMVKAAFNDAHKKAKAEAESAMGQLTGGLKLPGM